MVRPFYRTFHSDFASDQGASLVLSNVGQVLGTRKGTLPWRPAFGSSLEQLRHQANNPILRERAKIYVEEALGKWESKARLKRLTVVLPSSLHRDENQITLRAGLSIDGLPEAYVLENSFVSVGRGVSESKAPEPLNYNLRGTLRILRGMRNILPPPLPAPPQLSPESSVGLLRPFARGRDFGNGGGAPEIVSNVGQLFGTDKGTIPWRPEFGSGLQRLRHQSNTPALRELARHYVSEALGRWEPRALATKVEVVTVRKPRENEFTIRALCKIAFGAAETDFQFAVAIK